MLYSIANAVDLAVVSATGHNTVKHVALSTMVKMQLTDCCVKR